MSHKRNVGRNWFLESNNNAIIIYHNLWDKMKAVLGGKFIAGNAHITKPEQVQINNLMKYLKVLEKTITQIQS